VELDPHVLLETILKLSDALPESEVADNLVDALTEGEGRTSFL
jgi:hypothetical protein